MSDIEDLASAVEQFEAGKMPLPKVHQMIQKVVDAGLDPGGRRRVHEMTRRVLDKNVEQIVATSIKARELADTMEQSRQAAQNPGREDWVVHDEKRRHLPELIEDCVRCWQGAVICEVWVGDAMVLITAPDRPDIALVFLNRDAALDYCQVEDPTDVHTYPLGWHAGSGRR